MDLEALVYPDLGMLCIQGPGSSRPICLKSLLALFGFVAGWNFLNVVAYELRISNCFCGRYVILYSF